MAGTGQRSMHEGMANVMRCEEGRRRATGGRRGACDRREELPDRIGADDLRPPYV